MVSYFIWRENIFDFYLNSFKKKFFCIYSSIVKFLNFVKIPNSVDIFQWGSKNCQQQCEGALYALVRYWHRLKRRVHWARAPIYYASITSPNASQLLVTITQQETASQTRSKNNYLPVVQQRTTANSSCWETTQRHHWK